MKFAGLAVDYDGTIAIDGVFDPGAAGATYWSGKASRLPFRSNRRAVRMPKKAPPM